MAPFVSPMIDTWTNCAGLSTKFHSSQTARATSRPTATRFAGVRRDTNAGRASMAAMVVSKARGARRRVAAGPSVPACFPARSYSASSSAASTAIACSNGMSVPVTLKIDMSFRVVSPFSSNL